MLDLLCRMLYNKNRNHIKSKLRKEEVYFMRRLLGVLLILVAVVGGLYVGGWLFLFKGVVGIIEAIKAGCVATDIAIGICKIAIGIPVTEIIACIIGFTGFGMAVIN